MTVFLFIVNACTLNHLFMAYEVLGVGAGERGHEIMIAPADLVRASRAIVVNLTDRLKPVFLNEGEGND